MSFKSLTSKANALLACIALLTAAIGCNPGAVTAPETSQDVVTSPSFIRILSTPKGDHFGQASTIATTVSAENGGTVSNGWVTLDFPAGALNEDTEISIEMLNDGTLSVELSPHGIQFNAPVTMTMDLKGTNAEGMSESCSTLWLNEDEGQWVPVTGLDADDPNQLKSQLEHFSKYSGGVEG